MRYLMKNWIDFGGFMSCFDSTTEDVVFLGTVISTWFLFVCHCGNRAVLCLGARFRAINGMKMKDCSHRNLLYQKSSA